MYITYLSFSVSKHSCQLVQQFKRTNAFAWSLSTNRRREWQLWIQVLCDSTELLMLILAPQLIMATSKITPISWHFLVTDSVNYLHIIFFFLVLVLFLWTTPGCTLWLHLVLHSRVTLGGLRETIDYAGDPPRSSAFKANALPTALPASFVSEGTQCHKSPFWSFEQKMIVIQSQGIAEQVGRLPYMQSIWVQSPASLLVSKLAKRGFWA